MTGAHHWDGVYAHGADMLSWYQANPGPSLAIFDSAGVTVLDSCIDVGGGASSLIDALIGRGHLDVSVLDVSAQALQIAKRRLGADAARARWIHADICAWQPARTYRVWHDRAVLHFLTDDHSRQSYGHALGAATEPGSLAVIATFAPDGPQRCSGLPVCRYSAEELADLLGEAWQLVGADREQHRTPGGTLQPFTWAAFRRLAPARTGSTRASEGIWAPIPRRHPALSE